PRLTRSASRCNTWVLGRLAWRTLSPNAPLFRSMRAIRSGAASVARSIVHHGAGEKGRTQEPRGDAGGRGGRRVRLWYRRRGPARSEEHTSELQSRENLVCRLLLEKKQPRSGQTR